MSEFIYNQNTNNCELKGLDDAAAPGAYLNAATVTVTLKDEAGNAVTGAENVTMDYVSGSNGEYLGKLPHTIALVDNDQYIAEVTADAGAVGTGFWEVPVTVLKRYG